ncbi:MAG: hypothetical protein WCH85_09045 [Methanomicrobiales archaeon]
MTKFPHSTGSFDKLARIFSYDRNLPLDLRTRKKSEGGITIHTLSWVGLSQDRIKGYLVEPEGKESVAGIVFVHPGPGDRSPFLDEARELAGMGAACLLIEPPWSDGARFGCRAMSSTPEELRTWYVQMAVDLRRSLDLLETFPRVDKDRIGFVGHSFGALFGGILSGVEKRISSSVLMAGVGSFTDVAVLNIPDLKGEPLETFRVVMDPIDPVHYLGHAAPSSLFFQFGRNDAFFPKQKFLDFSGAALDPKHVRWYDADHYLDAAARIDRREWLGNRLGLGGTLS